MLSLIFFKDFSVFFFFNNFIYLFISYPGSLLLLRLFSSCHVQSSPLGSFSYCIARALGRKGSVVAVPGSEHSLSSCSTWA